MSEMSPSAPLSRAGQARAARLVILISGRGSNMQALVQAATESATSGASAGAWPVQVAAVISNRPQAAGLAWAAARGIATQAVDHTAYASHADPRGAFEADLRAAIDAHAPDLVVLAGFMRILGAGFVQHYAGRMLNIHPSLLPAFPGLHTHQRALDAGCRLAGSTVHVVTPELDHGPIVAQAAVPVFPQDDADRLAARVLRAEHVIYPRAVRAWLRQAGLGVAGPGADGADGHAGPLWHFDPRP